MANGIREEFEEWYCNTGLYNVATWREDKNRYTVMTEKQLAWFVWNASRGIQVPLGNPRIDKTYGKSNNK